MVYNCYDIANSIKQSKYLPYREILRHDKPKSVKQPFDILNFWKDRQLCV